MNEMPNDGMTNDETGMKHDHSSFGFRHSLVIRHSSFVIILVLLALVSCGRESKLTTANYDQVSIGMSKAQVETILGKPTSFESKDLILYHKTTYKYEDGKRFAMITFKNNEVDGKDTNLGREP